MTHHALDEMIADDLHVQDIEHIVSTGSIIRVAIDRETCERKFVIFGKSCEGFAAEVVARIKGIVAIMTVYRLGRPWDAERETSENSGSPVGSWLK